MWKVAFCIICSCALVLTRKDRNVDGFHAIEAIPFVKSLIRQDQSMHVQPYHTAGKTDEMLPQPEGEEKLGIGYSAIQRVWKFPSLTRQTVLGMQFSDPCTIFTLLMCH
eukprot:GHVL01024541.1.p1 GENE.GHVL01024541.1~~GHVL01024541.1.p1  ORF type:complete len:109 (-),score=6.75 GHVL01024541.1:1299-1625(-)